MENVGRRGRRHGESCVLGCLECLTFFPAGSALPEFLQCLLGGGEAGVQLEPRLVFGPGGGLVAFFSKSMPSRQCAELNEGSFPTGVYCSTPLTPFLPDRAAAR